MKLVVGGYAQGKLTFVLEKYGEYEIWDGVIPERPESGKKTVIINHFHRWVKSRMEKGGHPEEEILTFSERCPNCIIISDEIGNGIVPVEAFEREYRERTGRILMELASQAEEVVRVICGIGQKIK